MANNLPSVVPLQTLFSLLYSQAQGRAGDTINTTTSNTGTQINVMQGIRNQISRPQLNPIASAGTIHSLPTTNTTESAASIPVVNNHTNTVGQTAPPQKQSTSWDIPIKVLTNKKRDGAATYMLHIILDHITDLDGLRKAIREQLGQSHVSRCTNFAVGYVSGSHKISFVDTDDIKSELRQICTKKKVLWCDGSVDNKVVCIDSDSDSEPPSKKQKVSSSVMKVQRVDKLAEELKERHGDKYSRVQCKLWAEAIDVQQHKSKDVPPNGPIWSNPKAKRKVSSPPKASTTVSPGRKIDLQEKLLKQIEMVHSIFEKGAITEEQYLK
uniref:Uncharacterized protein n=1 Tax=Amphimedon queenslandica TaxID=400682 RepID=A0A1X7TNV0_AMPQE